MAIVEMRKLGVYGTKKHRKAVLEFLQKMGAVEVDSPNSENVPFEKMDTSSQRCYQIQEHRKMLYDAVVPFNFAFRVTHRIAELSGGAHSAFVLFFISH